MLGKRLMLVKLLSIGLIESKYLKGFTPEWVSMWIFRLDLFLNVLLHLVHLTLRIWGGDETDVLVRLGWSPASSSFWHPMAVASEFFWRDENLNSSREKKRYKWHDLFVHQQWFQGVRQLGDGGRWQVLHRNWPPGDGLVNEYLKSWSWLAL